MPRPPSPPVRSDSEEPARAAGVRRACSEDGLRLDVLLERSARSRAPLSEAFACHVVAHAACLLHPPHRAVTPFHILLTEEGRVCVEDLAAPSESSLAYAAPECVRHHQPPDARAEVFSLGLVLLQLLTGRHLFPGAERFEAEVRHAGGSGADAALTACARELARCLLAYGAPVLESATRAVSVELRPLVHRALAVEPEARFSSSAELAHALREHLRHTGQSFGPEQVRAELEALGR